MTFKNYHVGSALGAIMVLLVAMVWNLHPAVFPDEYIHSRSAIWLPFSEAKISGYLYYLVYWSTGLFGDYYLQAARVLNALFHVAGCYLIYLTALKVIDKKFAAIISLSVAIGPLATYVAFFMPDSMYFFFFWVFMMLMVRIDQRSKYSPSEMAMSGVAFGLLWLVKPHALFILPVYPIYLLIRNSSKSLVPSATFIVVSIFTKFSFSMLLAGTEGMSWFGAGYSGHGEIAASNIHLISQEYQKISINLIGHLVVLTSIMGLSMVVVLSRLRDLIRSQKANLGLFVLMLTSAMIVVVSIFAVSVHVFEENTAHRLYIRYYGFALPLFMIAVFTDPVSTWDRPITPYASVLATIIAVVGLAPAYYLWTRSTFYPYKIIRTDVPEIATLVATPVAFYLVSFLTMSAIFLWLYKARMGLYFYAHVIIPLVAILTLISSSTISLTHQVDHEGIIAGEILRDYVETSDHDVVLVAGTNRFKNDQVRMFAKSGYTGVALVQFVDTVPDSLVNGNIMWILTPDSLRAPADFRLELSKGRVLLYKRLELEQ